MYPPPVPPHYQEVSHLLHLFLCFVTFGFWLPVWIIMAIVVRTRTRTLAISTNGSSQPGLMSNGAGRSPEHTGRRSRSATPYGSSLMIREIHENCTDTERRANRLPIAGSEAAARPHTFQVGSGVSA